MRFVPTKIPDVILIEPKIFGDERGFFMETYKSAVFEKSGIDQEFVQDNHSGSQKSTLRGLHYQIRHTQGKLLRVVVGEIFDVAVDLRQSSATFGKWVGEILNAENKRQIWVPPGFAHGFYVLSDWAELIYKTTDIYSPKWERTLLWNDPKIGIEWPILRGIDPILSGKDQQGDLFEDAELFD